MAIGGDSTKVVNPAARFSAASSICRSNAACRVAKSSDEMYRAGVSEATVIRMEMLEVSWIVHKSFGSKSSLESMALTKTQA